MQRREFITLLGGTAAGWPLAAHAQRPAMPTVGYLSLAAPGKNVEAFRKGLSETGFVEARSVAIEYRWPRNEHDRLSDLAADLVRRQVAIIVTPGDHTSALAAKSATITIPIVFGGGGDPVQTGLVASLNRPGGNVTGVTTVGAELGAKRLGLLHELVPTAARFAVLINPTNPSAEPVIRDARAAASAIGRQIEVLSASTNGDIDAAFANIVRKRVDGLLVSPDTLFMSRRVQLAALAVRYAAPVIYPLREYAEAGGLMSYGTSLADQFRQVGIYTGRILKGEKPADLPVMQPTRFEFVVNLQIAKTTGIDIPAALLARADEVIE